MVSVASVAAAGSYDAFLGPVLTPKVLGAVQTPLGASGFGRDSAISFAEGQSVSSSLTGDGGARVFAAALATLCGVAAGFNAKARSRRTAIFGTKVRALAASAGPVDLHVIGLSHKQAPVAVRERMAVPEREWNAYSRDLVADGRLVSEAAVLSTCNRFELYFSTPKVETQAGVEHVRSFLESRSGLSKDELSPYLYLNSGHKATRHLFEVASGLDSLVLGESQILSQVKACLSRARGPDGSGGMFVTGMLSAGTGIGKLVRAKTAINEGTVSVSSVAVKLMAQKISPKVGKKQQAADAKNANVKARVCVVGAGNMSRLLVQDLLRRYKHTIEIVLVNRSKSNAQALLDALTEGKDWAKTRAMGFENLRQAVDECDVVFTATGSKVPIVTPDLLQQHSGQAEKTLIDISVPMNIDPDCANIPFVKAYTVDDLKQVIDEGLEKRQGEVVKVQKLIAQALDKFGATH